MAPPAIIITPLHNTTRLIASLNMVIVLPKEPADYRPGNHT